jgi:NAD(P)-dependent dehydrogenase (short-subunit alcohol dehydrogenase family)
MPPRGPVPDFPLKDKIVLVTGGGSGIGFAFSKLCHEKKGARVLVGDLKLVPEANEYVSSKSSSSSGDTSTIVFEQCDVTSWKSLHDLISASVKHFGAVPDVYAPIAGIFEPPWSNFWDDSESGDAYKTIQINVNHPIKLTRLAMKALAGAEKQGVVVLVASTAGIRGNYLASLYCASKHAIVGFAKSMGQADIDEGVRINCILPGMVKSPLWTDREDDFAKRAKYEEREGLVPDDIAEVMVRMVEDGGRYKGGVCVLKTPYEERLEEVGYEEELKKQKEGAYDPSPRPVADLKRVEEALGRERGVKWE